MISTTTTKMNIKIILIKQGTSPVPTSKCIPPTAPSDDSAVLVDMFKQLKEYTRELQEQNSNEGVPLQRPLLLHYEDDPQSQLIQYQYLYGPDLLVAPVVDPEVSVWNVYFPP